MKRRSFRPFAALVALAAAAGACATGTVGDTADGAPATTGDSGTSAADVAEFDLVSPFDDVPVPVDVPPVDTGAMDAGIVDVPVIVVDSGVPADRGTTPVDTGSMPPADVLTCASGQTVCGATCADLQNDAHNCGSCGHACGEVQQCTGGACMDSCPSPRMFCGTGADMRCADVQTDIANCGTCGHACATGNTCTAGSCAMAGCGAGASDCNRNTSDGCEVVHAMGTATCAANTFLGAQCGDASCGFLCPSTSWHTLATQSGLHSAWFHGRSTVCPNCITLLQVRITLAVPAGIDYDLYVYRPCGTLVGSSARTAGMTDSVTITQSDTPTSDDSFDYVVEVRWFSGASCTPWTLTVESHGSSATSC